jgi:hypothetical protein
MVIDGRTLETASHGDCGGENSDSDLERRRKNNRENMRRRRADPMRSAQEQEKRKIENARQLQILDPLR